MIYNDIVDCLRTALRQANGSKAELKRAIAPKSSPSTFYRAFKETPQLPAPEELCGWLDALGCKIVSPGASIPGFKIIKKVAALAGAGSSLVTSSEIIGEMAFEEKFLTRLGVCSSHAVLMDVQGDSMSPVLSNGDTLLVDQSQIIPSDGKIFVLSFGEELLVKRLQRIPSGWNICSENPAYPPISVRGQETDEMRIHGQVRWWGHRAAR